MSTESPVEQTSIDTPLVDDLPSNTAEPEDRSGLPSDDGGEPKKFAGKYDSIEDLERGYTELLAKMSGSQKASKDDAPPSPQDADDAQPTPETNDLDIASYEKTYLEHGALTEDQYAELAKRGIGKEMVTEFIELRQAEANRLVAQVYDVVGGKQAWDEMTTWAQANWSQSDIDAFNAAMDTNNMDVIKMAVEKLAAQAPKAPTALVQGSNSGGAVDGSIYSDKAQLHRDQADERYQTDPAFRQAVEDKVRRTYRAMGA